MAEETSKFDDLKQAVRAGTDLFKAFAQGDELLSIIDNAEANIRELQDAQTREANKLTNLQNEAADIEKTVKNRMDRADAAAKQITDQAQAKAEAIEAEAKKASDVLLGDSEDRAERLKDQIAHDEEVLEGLQNRIELARSEEDRLNQAIKQAQAKIKNFTGE